ncbi:helix-turn-helix transcriptional regulator [Streptomyces sp. MB22_4]|uniref:helix-turn-helix transcriptional regulator n=1 Tax=Streptomyces sp. MB22_4 TaxID=3383120 RepID=UPI0039A2D04A
MLLYDRGTERAALDGLLGRAREGLSGVVVLRGDAGIGKTALLEYAAVRASGFRVSQVAGVEVEQELGFAALHRLLLPFLSRRGRLPAPQRDALETAFGMSEAPPPDRFLVGLATLTLLADVAAEQPLLIVCDDAQWVDRESLDVLAFVSRRLHADAIVMLFGVRETDIPRTPFGALPELELAGLPDPDALALLTARVDGGIDRVVARRILTETAGNPLAIRELARSVAAGELTEGEPLPLDRRVEARFLAQVRGLPPLVRTVLLTAAADPTGDADLVRRAVQRLRPATDDEVAQAFEDARRMDLLADRALDGTAHFRHPLIRSAVYGGAPRLERRRAHAALAAELDRPAQAERRAWHRAAASHGPDEAVAAELEACAERAREHGGYLAQAAFLQRAAELSPQGVTRDVRLLAACAAALTAGAPYRAEQLLELLSPDHGTPRIDAQARRFHGLISVLLGRDDAVDSLLAAARILLETDPRAARDTLLEAIDAVCVAGSAGAGAGAPAEAEAEGATGKARAGADAPADAVDAAGRARDRNSTPADSTDTARGASAGAGASVGAGHARVGAGALDIARSALDAPPVPGEPGVADLLLAGHATLIAVGHPAAAPILCAALTAMQAERAEFTDAARWILLGMIGAIELWDLDTLGACARRYAAAARGQGALRMLQVAAHALATWELSRGNLSAAEEHFAEFKDVSEATGADPLRSHPSDVMLHAWRGDDERTRAAVAALVGPGSGRAGGLQVQLARSSLVLLELGHCHYREAQAAAQAVFEQDPPHFGGLALADLVEAAVRNDDRDTAERALARLAERAVASGTPWAMGLLARARALLAADAEPLFEEALAHLAPAGLIPEVARTRLLYGEWLRRRRRRQEAREQLRAAHELFVRMGAAAFAERARLELTATGGRTPAYAPGSDPGLTPQEARVARLAAEGATNQEIAAALFLSASTVEYHLAKVFRKLGIGSRRRLREVLPP